MSIDDLEAMFDSLKGQGHGKSRTGKAAAPAKKAHQPPEPTGEGKKVPERDDHHAPAPAAPASRGRQDKKGVRGAGSRREGPAPVVPSGARRTTERQEPIADGSYDPPIPPAKAHEAEARLFGYKGSQPPAFVPNAREFKDWPKKHAPGALKEGDCVWYRDQRYWICWAPADWTHTSYIRIVDHAWRPGGNIMKEAILVNVHADLVELAPVKGPAFAPQPTKHAVETRERMKAEGVTDIGDDIATMLRGKDLEQTYAIAAKYLGATVAELKAKYSKLNPGQQRMNLGNRMRGLAKKRGKA